MRLVEQPLTAAAANPSGLAIQGPNQSYVFQLDGTFQLGVTRQLLVPP